MERVRWNTSFAVRDSERRERHGCLWEKDELAKLEELFLKRYSLKNLCEELQRPANGVLPKLVELRLLTSEGFGEHYLSRRAFEHFANQQPTANAQRAERKAMNITGPIVIENQTNINGQDISKYSDSELYGLIAEQEAKIRELETIQNKPKRLVAEIEKRQAGIQALVTYMDSKE